MRAVAAAGSRYDEGEVLTGLWDLVWAGFVTNDSLAPVRALVGGRARRTRRPVRSARRVSGAVPVRVGWPGSGRRRVRDGGRWSRRSWIPRPLPTEAAHARALQLLERYGVLTREAALGEGAEGGFAGVYPVLKALEERGQIRRGYFVAGLGAAQFALPGAVDRLRVTRRPIAA